MSSQGLMTRWYAVQTRSNFEKRVANELDSKRLETYCPVFRELHQWADRKRVIERPLFQGYVFAKFADSGSARLSVLTAPGTVRIVGAGAALSAIPDGEIEAIRRVMNAGQGCSAHPFLREGSRVRVRRGALRDLEGILVRVKNQARLVVSLTLLSQAVSAEVDASDVEMIHGNDRQYDWAEAAC
jgi:transcription termination/antitermination protein NusG